MKSIRRNLILTAAALVTALGFAPRSDARVVVRVVGVRPGPGYVFVEGAWILPPFAGAVWVPGHYQGGFYLRGHWRA